jgi:hypothetical protein
MYDETRVKVVDRREMLRVKIKSLAEEARIIRREEYRTHGELRNELHNHRVLVVRPAARNAHVAYGLIRGRPWERIEPGAKSQPDWKKVKAMCQTYGPVGFVEPEQFKKAA